MSTGQNSRRTEEDQILNLSQGPRPGVLSAADISAPLCKTCQAMLRQFKTRKTRSRFRGNHHNNSKQLLLAVAYGCGICVRIQANFGDRSRVHKFFYEGHYLMYEAHTDGINVLGDEGFIVIFHVHDTKIQCWLEFENLACLFTGGPAVLQRAEAWLRTCLQSHRHCGGDYDSLYSPPRLLYLESSTVKLLDSASSVEQSAMTPYATLSYCSGRSPIHLQLTAQNMSFLLDGVESYLLAKTFQDAIKVCVALGIHYLWIDSLCILQSGPDHDADWQKHLTEMSAIYENSTLNIAANSSDHAEGGCFSYRDVDDVKPCIINTTTTTGTVPTLMEDLYPVHINQRGPLLQRGWCYQEHLLSPRILRLGADQISWECSGLLASETYPSGIPMVPFVSDSPLAIPSKSKDMQWDSVVNVYSGAALTNPRDKLPAVAGIAERLVRHKDTTYVAGFLRNSLPTALLWERVSALYLIKITNPYRAPSWSWASYDGEVIGFQRPCYQNVQALCSIEAINLDYVNPEYPYGQLRGGSIRLACSTLDILELGDEDDYRRVHGACLLPAGMRDAYNGSEYVL